MQLVKIFLFQRLIDYFRVLRRLKDQNSQIVFKRALEKSLDLLGEPSKRSLLVYLEQDYDISFKKNECPRLKDLESALNSILGRGSYLITEELRRNIETQTARPARKRVLATKLGRKYP